MAHVVSTLLTRTRTSPAVWAQALRALRRRAAITAAKRRSGSVSSYLDQIVSQTAGNSTPNLTTIRSAAFEHVFEPDSTAHKCVFGGHEPSSTATRETAHKHQRPAENQPDGANP